MANVRTLDTAQRQAKPVQNTTQKAQNLFVIPYNAPWYSLLLNGVLNISASDGKRFAVKTGSTPKKHRGLVGFYNSKGRVKTEVVKRHGLNINDLSLGMLVGVGYLVDSRKLTDDEKYQWYLKANRLTEIDFNKLYRRRVGFDPSNLSVAKKVEFLFNLLHDFMGDPIVIAGPMDVGHFYLPGSLKRFSRPIPFDYPAGPVQGTTIYVIPQIQRALEEKRY